jgi:hypothetical protein
LVFLLLPLADVTRAFALAYEQFNPRINFGLGHAPDFF